MATSQDKAYELELEDVKRVMETEHGRRVMGRLINMCGVYRTSYNPNMPDSHTAFHEGSRNIGLMMTAKLQEASPALFVKMIEEDNNDD